MISAWLIYTDMHKFFSKHILHMSGSLLLNLSHFHMGEGKLLNVGAPTYPKFAYKLDH